MKIRCTGHPQHCARRFLLRALRFYLKHELGTPPEGFRLSLVFKNMGPEGREGLTEYWWDDGCGKITVHQGLSEERTLQVIAHETVHLVQYLTGKLKQYRNDDTLIRWMGEVYPVVHESDPGYWFTPWELEALGRERGLASLFIEDYNSKQE